MQKKNNSLHQRLQTNTVRRESEPADASENPNELETHGVDNDCGSQVEDGVPSASAVQSPGHRLYQVQRASGTLARRATGPRTRAGKEISRFNATKHGIFAKATLIFAESKKEWGSLLHGFQEYFQPQGTVEELLVEKLATLAWRYGRLLKTEAAEIRKAISSQAPAQKSRVAKKTSKRAEVYNTEDYLNTCVWRADLRHLIDLRQKIESEDLDWERAEELLNLIPHEMQKYRTFERDCEKRLHLIRAELEHPDKSSLAYLMLLAQNEDAIATWLSASDLEKSEEPITSPETSSGSSTSGLSPAARLELLLRFLCEEIEKHEAEIKRVQERYTHKTSQEDTAPGVPSTEVADRLLRYEASLDRAFDRTLSQLERLQRTRLGQPVAPAIQVNLSR